MDGLTWTTSAELRTPRVALEVRDYARGEQFDDYTSDPGHLVILCLDGLAPDARGRRIGENAFSDIGAVMFIPAGVKIHAMASLEKASRVLRCRLDPDIFAGELPSGDRWTEALTSSCMNIRSSLINDTMHRLGREAFAPGFGAHVLIDGLASSILIEILRQFRPDDGDADIGRGPLPQAKLRLLSDYIESHAGSPTLGELAELCGISASHLSRLYKQTTGRTLHSDVEYIRANRAKTLLAQTSLPLKEIAYRLGFSGASNFSVAFRRAVGQSPGAYRRSIS